MKYIYEGHMGGLYCSDYEIEDTYCEQCGDSDWLIGTANTAIEAWELLKDQTDTFDDSKCDNCPHSEDYDYCDEECEEAMHSGGYTLAYVMEFIAENFDTRKIPIHEVYLIGKARKDDNYVFINCQPKGYKFGDAHAFPKHICMDEKYTLKLVKDLIIALDNPDYKSLKEVSSVTIGKKIIHIFEIYEDIPDDKEEWNNRASYMGDGWYGYHNKNDLKLIPDQEFLRKYL